MGKDNDYLYYHKKLFQELEDKEQQEKKEFLDSQEKLLKEKKQLDKKESEITKSIKNIKLDLRRLKATIGFWILVPFIGGYAGYLFGSQTWKYKITTNSFNMKTKEKIGDEIITYKEDSFTYKIVVKKYLPWEEKIDGTGYTREVLEYEYIERTSNRPYDVNSILQSVTPKYYRESKEVLDSNDNTSEPEIIITESYLDANERISDQTFAIIFGILVLLMLELLLTRNNIRGLLEEYNVEKLKKDLASYKITKKTIYEEYVALGDKVVKLQEEYEDKSIVTELDNLLNEELLDTVKKYVKKNNPHK